MNDRNYRNEEERPGARVPRRGLLYMEKRFWLLIAAVICISALLSWMVYMLLMPGDVAAGSSKNPEHLVVQSPDAAGNGNASGNSALTGDGSVSGNQNGGGNAGAAGSAQMGPMEQYVGKSGY